MQCIRLESYTQQTGEHYTQTYSSVVKMIIVITLVACVVKKGWDMFQHDVNNVFLHGDLHEKVYIKVPRDLDMSDPGLICKLSKSLYELKQASRRWYAKLTEALSLRGTHSRHDYSFLAMYVDDVVLIGIDTNEIAHISTTR